jgi:hypothetical protein
LTIISLALGLPVVIDVVQTGIVPQLPTAVLAATIMIIAVLVLMVGRRPALPRHATPPHPRPLRPASTVAAMGWHSPALPRGSPGLLSGASS